LIILGKMENDFYFDTSIWIDIYEKRGYNGEVAKKLMEKVIKETEDIFGFLHFRYNVV